MSRTNAFDVSIDPRAVDGLADRIALFDSDRLGRIALEVVNDVIERFDARARKGMNAGIALDDGYISGRMTTVRATDPVNPKATITAQGPRAGLTVMGHYSPKLVYGGQTRKGKPKATGVQVEIKKGQPKTIPGAYLMTLRRGVVAGDQVGVFIRELGKARHLYAVAPYSLFRHQLEVGLESITDDLATTADDLITTEYGKVFG